MVATLPRGLLDSDLPRQGQLFFESDWQKRFDQWIETDEGRMAANRFIRVAYGCHRRGIKLGAKAIWERLRWNFLLRKASGEHYRLNNNYTAYMARLAMDRVPSLQGYFETREVR